MVGFARASRAPATPPRIEDHWHAAYAVYDCDTFLQPFLSISDPDGIHSHQDGVIHIHPWNSSATGSDARLDIFFESMGARVTDDEISAPGIGVLEAGSECDGETTIIRAARFRWSGSLDEDGGLSDQYLFVEDFTDDFGDIQLLEDREAFTIARVPASAEIPPPPEDRLATAFQASLGDLLSSGPETDVDPIDVSTDVDPADDPADVSTDVDPADDPADVSTDVDPADESTSDGG